MKKQDKVDQIFSMVCDQLITNKQEFYSDKDLTNMYVGIIDILDGTPTQEEIEQIDSQLLLEEIEKEEEKRINYLKEEEEYELI